MTAFGRIEGQGPRYAAARSKRAGLWLLVTLAGLGQIAKVGAQQGPALAPSVTSHEVSGVVVDAITGKPIAGALVSTVMPEDWHIPGTTPRRGPLQPIPQTARPPRKMPGPEEQQATDENGRFRFGALEFAEMKAFYVSKPGYLAPNSSGSSISYVDVSVMQGMGELRFSLNPEAVVKGRVISREGTALQYAMITLYRVRYTIGRPYWIYFDEQRTDASGRYRFGELPAGTYFAVSQWLLDNDPLPPNTTNCNDNGFLPEGGFAPEAEPGVLDFRKAMPILLTEGEHAVADLKLQHQVFHPVTIPIDPKLNPGVVEITDRNGRSLEVSVNPSAHCMRLLHPSSDPQKRTINLPDGSYLFQQRAASSLDDPFETGGAKQPVFLGGYTPVTVAGKPVTVTLPATREDAVPPLQIRVHRKAIPFPPDASGKDLCSVPREGANVHFPPGMKAPPRFQVMLLPVDSFGGENSALPETQKDADLYELTGVKPGQYWVQTQALERGYVSAITAKGVNLMQHPLEIGTDQTGARVDITVRSDCGRIHFEKPSTPPPAGAIIGDPVGIVDPYYELLVPQFLGASPHGRYSEERTLMEPGRAVSATLVNLPPGHYKIYQTFDEDAVACFSHAELEKRLGPGRDVWLKAGEQVNLDVHDPPPQ